MASNAPYLPPNPLRPRAFGGKGAEGVRKEIPSNKGRIYDPACGSGGMFVQSEKFVESRYEKWLSQHGERFTDAQRHWLDAIKNYVTLNGVRFPERPTYTLTNFKLLAADQNLSLAAKAIASLIY